MEAPTSTSPNPTIRLAPTDDNEKEIAKLGGLEPIIAAAGSTTKELQSQAARALRNLSVDGTQACQARHSVPPPPLTNTTPLSLHVATGDNKKLIIELNGVEVLKALASSSSDRIKQQATRALTNLGVEVASAK